MADARFARVARLALLAALTTFNAIFPAAARAHAIVVAARPRVGATLATGDLEIRLEFNSRIDRQRSRVVLRGPDGRAAVVVLTAEAPPNVLAGRSETTIPGLWKLDWQVLSADGHVTRGEIAFSVREAAAP